MEQVNPWNQVVSLLSHLAGAAQSPDENAWHAGCEARPEGLAGRAREPHQRMPLPDCRSKITSIERQDDTSALVSWCDPTMCHYVDQVWIQVSARHGGYCALTGQRIERGTAIFKPRARGQHRPANSHEMILAAALTQMA
ncbi:MAG: DUF3331 domain-containing protein [Pseudomonadota bacterium]|jgi:hypothetical protein|uniref:DUF3331 domain-containing protein n=1 Tax=Burkholderiaceae TaxID=119060 RepID=UPI0014858CCC|nr:DUF3331 domain-containing protein [Burkholderia sp. 4M9327F10]